MNWTLNVYIFIAALSAQARGTDLALHCGQVFQVHHAPVFWPQYVARETDAFVCYSSESVFRINRAHLVPRRRAGVRYWPCCLVVYCVHLFMSRRWPCRSVFVFSHILSQLKYTLLQNQHTGSKGAPYNRDRRRLASSFIGSPRVMKQSYLDATAICRKFGKPDYFLTFTCNPKFKDITDSISRHQSVSDRPKVVARVFNQKKKPTDSWHSKAASTRSGHRTDPCHPVSEALAATLSHAVMGGKERYAKNAWNVGSYYLRRHGQHGSQKPEFPLYGWQNMHKGLSERVQRRDRY